MIDNEIFEWIKNNGSDYNFICLRGDDIDVHTGDILHTSRDMSDGAGKNDYLSGTSGYCVNPDDGDRMVMECIHDFLDKYTYKHYSIITGSGYKYGDDPRELVVTDAKSVITFNAA